jgi:hypothetical protein
VSHSEGALHSLEEAVGANLELCHLLGFQHVLDPFAGLELRVDHHGVLQGVHDHQGAADRNCVLGQAKTDPLFNLQVLPDNAA